MYFRFSSIFCTRLVLVGLILVFTVNYQLITRYLLQIMSITIFNELSYFLWNIFCDKFVTLAIFHLIEYLTRLERIKIIELNWFSLHLPLFLFVLGKIIGKFETPLTANGFFALIWSFLRGINLCCFSKGLFKAYLIDFTVCILRKYLLTK